MARRLVLLCCLTLLLAACGNAATGPAPLTLGAVYPLSGPQAEGGKQELAGVRAALQVARAEGALKRPVDLQVRSVESPEGARSTVDQLVDRSHVPAILGTYGSTLAEAGAAEADRRHTLYWESGAVADLVTQHRDYVFRTVATGMTLGYTATRFTHDVLLPHDGLQPAQSRTVIVNVDDMYGRSVGDGEAQLAAQLGMPVVDRITYRAGSEDAAAIAARVAAARPDYVWDVSYLQDGIAIWRAIRQAGVPPRAAIGTSSAFCMPEFGAQLGPDAVGTYAADKPDDQINANALTPEARDLLARATKAYAAQGMGSRMPIPAVAGFVAGWALVHGVLPQVHGPVTPDTIREAAQRLQEPEGTSINGGGIQFAPPGAPNAGQNLRAPSEVGQWQAPNVMRAVWPPPFATTSPKHG
ncbi:MAG TPA: ABC transporter substrate-binding protein [Candidatus Binatia bacterium]|nr:ABC transporter substrate-binding protein [Candidatus Binatia bacterium]